MAAPSARALAVPVRATRGGVLATLVAGGVLAALLVFVAWPVARVLTRSLVGAAGFTLAHYQEFFGTWRLLRILLNSLAVSAVSTTLTVAVALVLAYAVTRTDVPGKRAVSLAALLPLVAPPFLVSLAFILLFGRNGVVTRWLGLHGAIYGFHGIVLAQVVSFLPQAYILLASVLVNIDPALEEAAESLGAGPLTVLRRVTLALARPGLASAALVVFILCMADFGNPILIGGRYDVLATEIYARVIGTNDFAAAATMSVVLIVPCLAAYTLTTVRVGRRSYVSVTLAARTPLRPTPAWLRWPLFAVSGGVALFVVLVYALIPLGSLVRLEGSDWSLSLRHYTLESAWPVWNSVQLAAVAGVLGTAVALLIAFVIERRRPPGTRAIQALSLLPAALPGTVVGVGYLLAFNERPLPLTGTLAVLVTSVVFWKLPVAVRAGVDALRRIDPALEEAAASLGAGPARTLSRVLMPLLGGPALSIFVYFFVNGVVTVSAVIFLVFPGFNLVSVAILTQVQNGNPGAACALGAIILAIVFGAMALVRVPVGAERVAVLER